MDTEQSEESLAIARRWCAARGTAWSVFDQAGRGGTAPVYTVRAGTDEFALKIYDAAFSSGDKGKIEEERVQRQVALGQHDCPSLVQVFEGGRFEDRLFLLMNRAPGRELEKVLSQVPRAQIRNIVDQVARAAIFLRRNGLCHRDIKSANVFVAEDFSRVTLLDLSVTRDIYDPVGIGTDHEGQLPIVATARYSPPEYLFRLIEPSEALWHALDIYQLGALLYDLIDREPLFQDEFLKSKENRYRFAWTVATVHPQLKSTDVDADLLFLARRALDKDWKRRSTLRLEDFLAETWINKQRALATLGLGGAIAATEAAPKRDLVTLRSQLRAVTNMLEERLQEYLNSLSVTCRHAQESPADLVTQLVFAWHPRDEHGRASSVETEFRVLVRIVEGPPTVSLLSTARLSAHVNGVQRTESIELPTVDGSAEAAAQIGELCEASLPELAAMLTRTTSGGS